MEQNTGESNTGSKENKNYVRMVGFQKSLWSINLVLCIDFIYNRAKILTKCQLNLTEG